MSTFVANDGLTPRGTPLTVLSRFTRRWRWLLAAAMALGAPAVASAHPIHTTLTAVRSDGKGITFTVRTFADDFSATVARFAGKTPTADSSVMAADVARYVDARMRITNAAGQSLVLRSCGIQRARDLYWICLRVDAVGTVRGVTVANRLLTELHADQVNIMQVDIGSVRRTVLFTKHTGAQPLVH
ncbi:MAG: hypothetical protein IT354_04585 [Gemmatimonadaceae bacterium]|nr:hypothetical protein [Gemmatimonadaceae bacterium]